MVVKFSPNGEKLLSIGNDPDHSVCIYDWEKGTQVNAKVDQNDVFGALWINDTEFVSNPHIDLANEPSAELHNHSLCSIVMSYQHNQKKPSSTPLAKSS